MTVNNVYNFMLSPYHLAQGRRVVPFSIMNRDESGYVKEFDKWNEKKKQIVYEKNRPGYKEGDVWWIHLGLNVGYEMDGKGIRYERPVVVLKKYNEYSFLAVPLSTRKSNN